MIPRPEGEKHDQQHVTNQEPSEHMTERQTGQHVHGEAYAREGGDIPHQASEPGPQGQQEGPVVRDKRRIDPQTGQVRQPVEPGQGQPAAGQPAGGGEPQDQAAQLAQLQEQLAQLQAQLAERTADLQRLQAEYANYRKRVERDREAMRELALVGVLTELLPVLDNIQRAREHGELEGGFKSVGESLESTVAKLGLQRFGERGDPFDPTIHEALMHRYSTEVSEPTCVEILEPGYRFGQRVIRAARVAVAEPDPTGGLQTPTEPTQPQDDGGSAQ
ncbi:Protein GrpE [Carbonactinospora thermoautotrophica]|uniref:Protein GrpE n=1 Tax=Carbonactinospora thermoautotrophica TaxID=1469144 RepID=A0A132MKV4_9ACTN|nr:nucleotide exchange factor GrpE [Carbonactinospora thermoautotrophica]KWW98490.1 Protein GrpE [Carbonactinospora thermoautotrophica]